MRVPLSWSLSLLHGALVLVAVPLSPASAQGQGTLRLEKTITADQLSMGYVGAVVSDARGRIYALETSPGARSVVVLDSTGKTITRLGRSGQGPGEFERVAHTLAWMGDTLLVFDPRASRLTGFDRDGKPALIHDWPLTTPAPTRMLSSAGGVFGVYVGVVSTGPARMAQAGATIERSRALKVVRINRSGVGTVIPAIADTVAGVVAVQCASTRSGDLPMVVLPFKNQAPLVAVTRAGEIARGHVDKYQIDIMDAVSGKIVRSIRRDASVRPFTSADLARTVEGAELAGFERESGGKLASGADRTRPCPAYEMLPKTGPPLRSVTGDDSGRLWIESMDPTKPGQLVLHVYDAAGKAVAETAMPERDMRVAPYVRGDRLFLVRADDLGVHSISIYRLQR